MASNSFDGSFWSRKFTGVWGWGVVKEGAGVRRACTSRFKGVGRNRKKRSWHWQAGLAGRLAEPGSGKQANGQPPFGVVACGKSKVKRHSAREETKKPQSVKAKK